jgi:hypothetical protein
MQLVSCELAFASARCSLLAFNATTRRHRQTTVDDSFPSVDSFRPRRPHLKQLVSRILAFAHIHQCSLLTFNATSRRLLRAHRSQLVSGLLLSRSLSLLANRFQPYSSLATANSPRTTCFAHTCFLEYLRSTLLGATDGKPAATDSFLAYSLSRSLSLALLTTYYLLPTVLLASNDKLTASNAFHAYLLSQLLAFNATTHHRQQTCRRRLVSGILTFAFAGCLNRLCTTQATNY